MHFPRFINVLLIFLPALFFLTNCDKTDDPYSAFEKGDYQSAFSGFISLANKGDLQAQNHLGVMYYLGLGRKRDTRKALKWFKSAAEKGFPGAQFNLANMYENGEAVQQDFIASYMWFYAAAEQGHERAEERMSLLLDDHKLFPNQSRLATELAKPYILNSREKSD